MVRLFLFAVLTIGLAACASVPAYKPAQSPTDFGYSDQKIEENRYLVTYNGNASTSRATVEEFLLYRMSEITLENGVDYFKVLDSTTECHTEYRTIEDEPCLRGSERSPMFPYCGYGFVCNPTQTVREIKRYEAIAFMTVHKGQKPSVDAYAFSAREVQQNLKGLIHRD